MYELATHGCAVSGLDIDPRHVRRCLDRGLDVVEGCAEQMPFPDQSFRCIVSSVVLPYTDERKAIAEWARVLKPGGFVHISCHGLGYALDYMLHGTHWRTRYYGFRMLLNSYFYQTSGRRLPGHLGDTLCQFPGRLRASYRRNGLELVKELVVESVAGYPRFLCHRLVKRPVAMSSSSADVGR
jgi:SAM-dependent methyltransferase